MIRFVSFAAVSSLPQAKKVSIQDQLATNRHHAELHGGTIVRELVIPGQSRSIVLLEEAERLIPAYAELRQLIQDRAFDVLIYLDRSRLGRKASLSMAVVELCHEAGIITYETENPPARLELSRSYDDLIVGAIKSVSSQREVEKLKIRKAMGMIARTRRGELPSGAPYGWRIRYTETGERLVELDETAAATIRHILIDLYLEDRMGAESIAAELTSRGLPHPSGQWTASTIHTMIRMVWRYAGFVEYNQRSRTGAEYIRSRGSHPAIISEELATAILEERERRAGARRAVRGGHILSQVVYCATCEKRMIVDRTNGRARQYLRCRGDHPDRMIRDTTVIKAVRGAIRKVANMTPLERERLLQDSHGHLERLEAQLERLEAQLAGLAGQMERADTAYTAGLMELPRYSAQVERIKAQRESLTAELESLTAELAVARQSTHRPERLEELASHGLRMIDHPDVAVANRWLSRHVRVWVDGGKVSEIEFI